MGTRARAYARAPLSSIPYRDASVSLAKRSHANWGPSTGWCRAAIIGVLLTSPTIFTIDSISIYPQQFHFSPFWPYLHSLKKRDFQNSFIEQSIYFIFKKIKSMKKRYNIVNKSSVIEYYIDVEELKNKTTIFTLLYSDNTEWQPFIRGKEAISLEDDGDGVRLSGINPKQIDYDTFAELKILIGFINYIQKENKETYSIYVNELAGKITI